MALGHGGNLEKMQEGAAPVRRACGAGRDSPMRAAGNGRRYGINAFA